MSDFAAVTCVLYFIGIVFALLLIFYEYDVFGLIITIGCFSIGTFMYVFEWWLFRPTTRENKK